MSHLMMQEKVAMKAIVELIYPKDILLTDKTVMRRLSMMSTIMSRIIMSMANHHLAHQDQRKVFANKSNHFVAKWVSQNITYVT